VQPSFGELCEGVSQRRVEVGDIQLHLAECGPSDGRLLIFLHGFPEYWAAWRHQIGYFARRGFHVVAPDQRGYNLSSKPRRVADYALDRLADDVVGLIDALGRKQALVVGHDWGAVAAWWAAIRRPSSVERLAVLNAPHPRVFRQALLSDPDQRRRTWYFFFFQLPRLPEFWYARANFDVGVRSVQGSAVPGTFSDDDMDRYRQAWSRPDCMRSMIHWYRAALRYPPKAVDDRVRVPTLLIWGERDRFLSPELIEPTLALCDDVELYRVPDARHWVQHEAPETVNEQLLAFFTS